MTLKDSKMKKMFVVLTVLILSIGFIGCDNGTTNQNNNSGGEGVFTLTDIPEEYNGKYVISEGYIPSKDSRIFGYQSYNFQTNEITAVKISNGSATIPFWYPVGETRKRYSDSDIANFVFKILNSSRFSESPPDELCSFELNGVTFSNGSVTKSFNDCELQ